MNALNAKDELIERLRNQIVVAEDRYKQAELLIDSLNSGINTSVASNNRQRL
jgi:prophage tail gpP-like protein